MLPGRRTFDLQKSVAVGGTLEEYVYWDRGRVGFRSLGHTKSVLCMRKDEL